MIRATGSQIIVKLLEAEGIDTVAGLPGGYILPLYDELNRSSIKHVLVRQEQAAGFIAQGMTRSTGKPAVCMVTSGPGAMNLLTAIADARCDSVPIIAFTGQVNTNLIGTDGFQEADTFGLSFPITKHSMMIKDPKDLLTAIPLAFSIAV
ncbi:MAG: acetolactate synthase large subunit, partial [Treponema sp.]|nr:acetolactate synthase large subunit [Treponema sp.]